MRSPREARPKARDSKRVLWVVERDGRPVSMSASSIGMTECYANWSMRVGHEVYKDAKDRIVEYTPTRRAKGAKRNG